MQTSFNALKIETKREVPLPARGDEAVCFNLPLPARGDEAVCFNQLSKIKQNSKKNPTEKRNLSAFTARRICWNRRTSATN